MKKLLLLFVLSLHMTSLCAQSIREFVFFGDSLSDNGNLYRKIQVIPKSPPYYEGRFSNGPVWSELVSTYFNQKFGITAQNYSVGGATALSRGLFWKPSYLKKELDAYIQNSEHTDKSSVLYIVWMGANDFLNETKDAPEILVNDVITEIMTEIRLLMEKGGRHFIIMDVPDFSKVPFAMQSSVEQRERLAFLSSLHHQKLQEAVKLLQKNYPLFHIMYVDVFSIFNDLLLNTQVYNQRYHQHIINLQDSCWQGGYRFVPFSSDSHMEHSVSLSIAEEIGTSYMLGQSPCDHPDDYLFWDKLHPTEAVHNIIAAIMIEHIEHAWNFLV